MTSSTSECDERLAVRSSTHFLLAQICAFVNILVWIAPNEWARLRQSIESGNGLSDWLQRFDFNTSFFLLLIAAPFVWLIKSRRLHHAGNKLVDSIAKLDSSSRLDNKPPHRMNGPAWSLALLVGVTSIAASALTAEIVVDGPFPDKVKNLPLRIHDEYSYLFQAETYLSGQLSFPSHPTAPQLFDQMHILNEGRFASRYFPGTGAWIAPFLLMGKPIWGHWLAGGLTAMFVFAAGRELAGNGVGFVAGLLTAISPGMAIFSNLLLSHHPCILGLSLFLFGFLRMMRTQRHWDAVLAGAGLSFAMLCRPLTAAGFGLPFAFWFLVWLCRRSSGEQQKRIHQRLSLATALITPLLLGFVIMLVHNRAITGSAWTTPYQIYTDTYTPRHIYGFNNVVRGEQHVGPKVIDRYDRWAVNLTPSLAVQNVEDRVVASSNWTLGIIPLALAFLFMFPLLPVADLRWVVLALSIVSLHAVYAPYWFVGILQYHYVFESTVLLLLIFAGATCALFQGWMRSRNTIMPIWWCAVISLAIISNLFPFDSLGQRSRFNAGIQGHFSQGHRYADFHHRLNEFVTEKPALVLIVTDPADIHMEYVTNSPGLDTEIIFGRYDPNTLSVDRIIKLFPNRTCYLFDQKTDQLTVLGEAVKAADL